MHAHKSREAVAGFARPNGGGPLRKRIAQLLGRTIFTASLALIIVTAVPYGAAEPWWEAAFECAAFALGGLWIVEGLLSGRWLVREHRLLIPLLALVVFGLVQSAPLWGPSIEVAGIKIRHTLSADPYETRRATLKLLATTLAAGLLLRYTSDERRLRALIYVVLGVGVASALFGILRQTTQHGGPGFILPYLEAGSGYGQFINRNHFAFLMEMSLGLALGLVAGGGAGREGLSIYVAALMPVWTALVLANSRGGILAMFCQVLFVALLFGTVRWRGATREQSGGAAGWLRRISGSRVARAVLAACLAITTAAGVVWVGGDPLASRLEHTPAEVSTETSDARAGARRAEIWKATWQLIKDHPVTGVGFGGYWVAIPEYHDASGELTPQQAHNDYLELLASGGVVGLTLGVWFIIAFIRHALLRLRSSDSFRRAACFGALAGILGVAVHSLVDFGLHVTINTLTFTALVAIATADGRTKGHIPQVSTHG